MLVEFPIRQRLEVFTEGERRGVGRPPRLLLEQYVERLRGGPCALGRTAQRQQLRLLSRIQQRTLRDRRIGLNVQYLTPHNRHQTSEHASAVLVAGVDDHGYFGADEPATTDLDPRAIERWRELDRRMKSNFTTR